ncbi:MAG: 50S ribosomal protein L22 [Parcubacteria group bacterium Gr01-1014_107]|nr:MAG: 50S ribosomal protein L22 [Parcubacteria group bacterium Gr01-1014_107]
MHSMEKIAQAKLRNLRQSPRKVRLAASLIRGKRVDRALLELGGLAKRASLPLKKLVKSAVANAKNLNLNPEKLFVKEVAVNDGAILYRRRFRARGSTSPIRKRTSHVTIVLSEQEESQNRAPSKKQQPIKTKS